MRRSFAEILVKFSKKLLYEDVEHIKRDVLVYMQNKALHIVAACHFA